MKRIILVLLAIAIEGHWAGAQRPLSGEFGSHNARMAALQPSLVTPLVGADPRLLQYARFSVSRQIAPTGAETLSFGNGRGMGVIAGNRFEFDYVPPPYISHGSADRDGIGDTATVVKYRIASGNAQRGNYALSMLLSRSFATGMYRNGAATDSYAPTLAGARSFGRIAAISSLGGTLPTGKIATQGRSIAWTAIGQAHLLRPLWVEVENNATFYRGGKHDDMVQNFMTPGIFYIVRGKGWKPTHPFFIVDGGMQIATSAYHSYDHNLITEFRVLF